MRNLLVTFFTLMSVVTFAQSKGTISGKIQDKDMGLEPLPFVSIYDSKDNTVGTTSDFDGNYIIKLSPGVHTLVFEFVGYETVKKQVTVKANATQNITIVMSSVADALDAVVLTAVINKESEEALVEVQKEAVEIVTAIGAEELSNKGVSDAEGAVVKTAGVTKQQGVKNVFVRGLGDRYNSTTYNGLPLPSDDPEYKNISLDYFSTDVIQNVGINKAFTSNIFGDVGGANIDISSKILSGNKDLSVGFSVGGNSQTITKSDFLTIDGTNTIGIQENSFKITDLGVYNFKNNIDPNSQNFQLNKSISVAGGKKYKLDNGDKFSFFAVASLSSDYRYQEGVIRNSTTDGRVNQDQEVDKYNRNASQLLMASLKYDFNSSNNLKYNTLLIHANSQAVSDAYGKNAPEDPADLEFLRRQQVNDNMLLVNQLLGDFYISDKSDLKLGLAYNYVSGNEPDRRSNRYLIRGGQTSPNPSSAGYHSRFYTNLKENDIAFTSNIDFKFLDKEKDGLKSKLDLGFDARYTVRNFEAVDFQHNVQGLYSVDINNADDFFNQQNLDNGSFGFQTGRGRLDPFKPFTYDGKRFVFGQFAKYLIKISENFTINPGLRGELVDLSVEYNTNIANSDNTGVPTISKYYVLPSLITKFSATEDLIFRAVASKTYTLPQFKEIAPFKYQDISFASQGNPDLLPSDNYNVDLKGEYYFGDAEFVSLTGFYKMIKNPISRVDLIGAAGTLSYTNLGDEAILFGAEFEFKKKLYSFLGKDDFENKLSFGLNASYLYSEVNLDTNSNSNFTNSTTELEGATPVLVNTDLTLNSSLFGGEITSAVVFNYFSDRVYSIGTQGYNNIVEKSITGLDFVSSYKLGNYSVKLKVKNILNPPVQLVRLGRDGAINPNDVVVSDFKRGLDASISIGYSF
ncbi:carboxypeptidase-like regulatory domain-containing protein [Wenyingzhuangia sp. chi5]|uniref:Carboxypeptidase-like regulatory domain-containing protein n=1 Tax=Wenyingzhuangia gilva TaxID=3057677 RepID=A0ABT8VPZ3_9FLAO|nr:TonB-dependent receptor [Wenyingzhuangia sp. chi5]MDO3694042.1 carboxypeptidase-like regulatory domain-containing protein [Wenyingzhuangia sp. chi5]